MASLSTTPMRRRWLCVNVASFMVRLAMTESFELRARAAAKSTIESARHKNGCA
jgi:hypothetical protein